MKILQVFLFSDVNVIVHIGELHRWSLAYPLGLWTWAVEKCFFLPLGCRLVHSSSLSKATKMQTTGCGVLKQNLSLRTLTGNCCCSLSGWWCWTTLSATLVSSRVWGGGVVPYPMPDCAETQNSPGGSQGSGVRVPCQDEVFLFWKGHAHLGRLSENAFPG